MAKLLYCDHSATCPMRPAAVLSMATWWSVPANPASTHAWGARAAEALEQARAQVASLIGVSPPEVVFTSGATEANNIALAAAEATRPGAVMVASAAEHAAVLEVVRARPGHILIPVDRSGIVDMGALHQVLGRHARAVVSVMAANNETGVVTNIAAVSEIVHSHGALLHCDATQAVGRTQVDANAWGVDLLSLSAHKFGGPVGTGALFVSRSSGVSPEPILRGGGQERGWRPGTVNVAGAVGAGAAAHEVKQLMDAEQQQARACRDEFEQTVLNGLPEAWVNGVARPRLAGVSSLTVPGRPAQALMMAMPSLAVSEGSACSSGAPQPSHVLLAMGLEREDADCTVRFSFGLTNEPGDGLVAAHAMLDAVRQVDVALTGTSLDRSEVFA